MRGHHSILTAAALAVSFALVGCDTADTLDKLTDMIPFGDNKKPLPQGKGNDCVHRSIALGGAIDEEAAAGHDFFTGLEAGEHLDTAVAHPPDADLAQRQRFVVAVTRAHRFEH